MLKFSRLSYSQPRHFPWFSMVFEHVQNGKSTIHLLYVRILLRPNNKLILLTTVSLSLSSKLVTIPEFLIHFRCTVCLNNQVEILQTYPRIFGHHWGTRDGRILYVLKTITGIIIRTHFKPKDLNCFDSLSSHLEESTS